MTDIQLIMTVTALIVILTILSSMFGSARKVRMDSKIIRTLPHRTAAGAVALSRRQARLPNRVGSIQQQYLPAVARSRLMRVRP
jgi:hypothetical protein